MNDHVARVRPVSASQHSGVDKALLDSFVFHSKAVRVAEDFVSDSGGSVDKAFVSTVMTSLNNATNESQLQHGLFNAMSILSTITVPAESFLKPPKEKDLNFFQKLEKIINPVQYQEKDMRTLLNLYAEKHISFLTDKNIQEIKEAQPGLFVRATSRPDLAVVVKNTADSDIAIGEVKNDDSYSVKDAVKQEGAYLMLLLYWWRVVVGREVSSVHGFTLCGPFCRDLKQRKRNWLGRPKTDAQYSVCLLRLSAPQYLGDIPCLTYFNGTCSLGDDSSARYLCQFLTNGQLWGQKKTAEFKIPCPSLFVAPPNFAQLSNQHWKLVNNGTAALVFQCFGVEGVSEVMNMAKDWMRLKLSIVSWEEYLEKQEQQNEEKMFYVKIVTKATDRNFASNLRGLRDVATVLEDDDFLRTYPVPPIDGDTCYGILMADRGARVTTQSRWQLSDLNRMFKDLWKRTTALSKEAMLQHGDIARHNILFEPHPDVGGRLVLIDWDEARPNPKSRVAQDADEYLHLQHPECLRGKPLLYTMVQLALLYWDLLGNHVQNNAEWWKDPNACPCLQDYATCIKRNDDLSIVENASNFVSNTESRFHNVHSKCRR